MPPKLSVLSSFAPLFRDAEAFAEGAGAPLGTRIYVIPGGFLINLGDAGPGWRIKDRRFNSAESRTRKKISNVVARFFRENGLNSDFKIEIRSTYVRGPIGVP